MKTVTTIAVAIVGVIHVAIAMVSCRVCNFPEHYRVTNGCRPEKVQVIRATA